MFSILKTCLLLTFPKKFGIPEKGASQKEEDREKLKIFKRFQCLLYSSQNHIKHRIWDTQKLPPSWFWVIIFDTSLSLVSSRPSCCPKKNLSLWAEHVHLPSRKTFCSMAITVAVGTKISRASGSPDEGHNSCLQNIAARARAELWGQHLCATSEPKSVTEASEYSLAST